jgi:hypothetical protein
VIGPRPDEDHFVQAQVVELDGQFAGPSPAAALVEGDRPREPGDHFQDRPEALLERGVRGGPQERPAGSLSPELRRNGEAGHHGQPVDRLAGDLAGEGHDRAGSALVQGDLAGHPTVDVGDPCLDGRTEDEAEEVAGQAGRIPVQPVDGTENRLAGFDVV